MIFPMFLYGGLFVLLVVVVRQFFKKQKPIVTEFLNSVMLAPASEARKNPPQPPLDPLAGILYSLSDVVSC